MCGARRGAQRVPLLLAVLGLAVSTFPVNAVARDKLSGRIYVTYQNSERAGIRREYLSERFEATLRDRVFERNDLALTFYFDNARDLTSDQTFRRYRGMLNLQNPYYTFNARYTPRQEITPIELPTALEIVDKQLLLDIHVPDAPRLRLSYGSTERFLNGQTGNRTTNLRGDLNYTYRIFSMGLNRYYSTSENSAERKATVTGADVRAAKVFGPEFAFDAGYQYQLSEIRPTPGLPQDITTHNLTSVFTSRYRRTLLGTLTLNRRYLTNDNGTVFKSTDDNDLLSALFFPFSPVNVEYLQTFVGSWQDTLVSQINYGTVQVLADGKVWRQVKGHVQLTKRFDTNTIDGVIPDNIYFVRIESFDRRGVDIRGELGVLERVQEETRSYRYNNSSMLDMYLRPWKNLTLVPRARYTRFGDTIVFTGNDEATYSLNGTWMARMVNMGMNLTHSVVTTGRQSVNNAATFNLSASLRGRSSFNVSYGIRETDQFATATLPESYDKSRTLNLWGQVWILEHGSLSANYTRIESDLQRDSNYVAVNYRQEF